MKLLLDTHIWIWSVSEPQRLTRRVARELDNTENQLWLSPVSMGDVAAATPTPSENSPRLFHLGDERALITMPLNEAPLTFEVAEVLSTINLPHSDPADPFLAASAKVFGLTLATSDRNLFRAFRAPEIPVL
jgi:PIN domain nuclease of toxin-antitoxin system